MHLKEKELQSFAASSTACDSLAYTFFFVLGDRSSQTWITSVWMQANIWTLQLPYHADFTFLKPALWFLYFALAQRTITPGTCKTYTSSHAKSSHTEVEDRFDALETRIRTTTASLHILFLQFYKAQFHWTKTVKYYSLLSSLCKGNTSGVFLEKKIKPKVPDQNATK